MFISAASVTLFNLQNHTKEIEEREVDLKVSVETSVLLKPLSHDRDFSLNSLSSHQSEKSIFCYFCNIISFNSLIFLDFFLQ